MTVLVEFISAGGTVSGSSSMSQELDFPRMEVDSNVAIVSGLSSMSDELAGRKYSHVLGWIFRGLE